MAAGVAALMLADSPGLSPAQIISRMTSSALAFPTSSSTSSTACHLAATTTDANGNYTDTSQNTECVCTTATCGAGMLNAAAAVSAASGIFVQITASSTTGHARPAHHAQRRRQYRGLGLHDRFLSVDDDSLDQRSARERQSVHRHTDRALFPHLPGQAHDYRQRRPYGLGHRHDSVRVRRQRRQRRRLRSRAIAPVRHRRGGHRPPTPGKPLKLIQPIVR